MTETMPWVDEVFLSDDQGARIRMGDTRLNGNELRMLVLKHQARLSSYNIDETSVVALRAAPGLDFVSWFLAIMRTGAQLLVLDHRLGEAVVPEILRRCATSHEIYSTRTLSAIRGFSFEPTIIRSVEQIVSRMSNDPILQLSSGTTASPKLIRRSAGSILQEIDRYRAFGGIIEPGGCIVVASGLAHTWGLFGGLLFALSNHIEFSLPERQTASGILDAVAGSSGPTTILGVPLHVSMLQTMNELPATLKKVLSAGAPLHQSSVRLASSKWQNIQLGQTYGMTEIGVIAADLQGKTGEVGYIAEDLTTQITEDGELQIATNRSPYLNEIDDERWRNGWFSTRDAADLIDGVLYLHGRIDGLVSLNGKKFHLVELESNITTANGISEAVAFVDTNTIEVFLTLSDPNLDVPTALNRLPEYMRPHRIHIRERLPRTVTGKISRQREAYEVDNRD